MLAVGRTQHSKAVASVCVNSFGYSLKNNFISTKNSSFLALKTKFKHTLSSTLAI